MEYDVTASPFTSDADRSLPKAEWTHPAHFAATLSLMRHRPQMDLAREMPDLIRAYNVATGGANTESAGYHETITQASLRGARARLVLHPDEPLTSVMTALLASPLGDKDWLLAYWTRERLMSVEARRTWAEPDLQPLPF